MLKYFLLIPRRNIEDFWIIGCFQLSTQTFSSMKEDKKVVFYNSQTFHQENEKCHYGAVINFTLWVTT